MNCFRFGVHAVAVLAFWLSVAGDCCCATKETSPNDQVGEYADLPQLDARQVELLSKVKTLRIELTTIVAAYGADYSPAYAIGVLPEVKDIFDRCRIEAFGSFTDKSGNKVDVDVSDNNCDAVVKVVTKAVPRSGYLQPNDQEVPFAGYKLRATVTLVAFGEKVVSFSWEKEKPLQTDLPDFLAFEVAKHRSRLISYFQVEYDEFIIETFRRVRYYVCPDEL